MENSQTPLLNLYAVRKSQNERFIIITLVEGQKPHRTFRKWLVPTSCVEGKPQAIVQGNKVMLELPFSKEFKKQAPENGPKMTKTDYDDDGPMQSNGSLDMDDDIPF